MILQSLFFSHYIYPLINKENNESNFSFKNYQIKLKISLLYLIFIYWTYIYVFSFNKISLLYLYNEIIHERYKLNYNLIEITDSNNLIYQVSYYTIFCFLITVNFYFYRYSYAFVCSHILIFVLSNKIKYVTPYLHNIYNKCKEDGVRMLNYFKKYKIS